MPEIDKERKYASLLATLNSLSLAHTQYHAQETSAKTAQFCRCQVAKAFRAVFAEIERFEQQRVR